MLGAALTVTISLLGAALFSSLSRIDGLQRDVGRMHAELIAEIASVRTDLTNEIASVRTDLRASHDDLAARIDAVNQTLTEHPREHAA